MINKFRFYFLLIVYVIYLIDFASPSISQNYRRENIIGGKFSKNGKSTSYKRSNSRSECWMNSNSEKHFKVMDELDERYATVRQEYQKAMENSDFDTQMLAVMLQSRGAAQREIQKVGGKPSLIPAGLNLGGYCMMRMPNSLLFFHRMKLRNNTHFRVSYLHNDLMDMVLHAQISLNDLHLFGSYDRSLTDKDPSVLFYSPTYGQAEFLLKNVHYTMQGRYRLLSDRLNIELVVSDITFDDALMQYLNNAANPPRRIDAKTIEDFLNRIKIDIDKWLKDYFNDYLMYFGIESTKPNSNFQQYEKEKTMELNNYMDHVIDLVVRKLHKVNASTVPLPKFTIYASNGMELHITQGTLRGLDSIYRRSVTTGNKKNDIRQLDAVVGFSNLKVIYHYEAWLQSNTPSLNGILILSADELTAHMGVAVMKNSESLDIKFEFLEQAKPESLTIEGAANRVMSNFKYILEQHVIAIMTNSVIHNIRLLGSLTKCVPQIKGNDDDNQDQDDSISNENDSTHKNKPDADTDIKSEQTDAAIDQENGGENSESKPVNPDNEQPNASIDQENVGENSESKPVNTDKEQTNTAIEQENSEENSELNSVNAENEQPNASIDQENVGEKSVDIDEENLESHNNVPQEEDQQKGKPVDEIFLTKDESMELEVPSNEDHHRQKMHLKYINNLTLNKMD